jgi:hypothetical protein
MAGRRLRYVRLPPGGVNGHHPYHRFTRVITGGLAQAELAGPDDCRGPVLNAQFAVHGALVGFHGVH